MEINKPLYIHNYLEINSNKSFFNYSQFRYTQLKSLKIINVSLHFKDLFNLLDNYSIERLDKMNCDIECDLVSVLLNKHNNTTTLELCNVNRTAINILNNLPNYINILQIQYPTVSCGDFYLNKSMTNLPPSLQKIILQLPFLKENNIYSTIANYERSGYFNILFEIKRPHECIVQIDISGVKYPILYDDKDNDNTQLTLVINNCEKIIIKKVIPCGLEVDYIYLDVEERQRFAQIGHEYLINQVNILNNNNNNNNNNDDDDDDNMNDIIKKKRAEYKIKYKFEKYDLKNIKSNYKRHIKSINYKKVLNYKKQKYCGGYKIIY